MRWSFEGAAYREVRERWASVAIGGEVGLVSGQVSRSKSIGWFARQDLTPNCELLAGVSVLDTTSTL
jgi:hypothetical protein